LIDADFHSGDESLSTYIDSVMRCYQDDVCATYAWLTAEALDLRPIFMGYGAVGVTRAGCGNVPEASKSYPYNFENSPINHKNADYIVINHGANDRPKGVELYLQKYEELLDVIRAHNPASQIIALSAFCGAFHAELGEMIARYNQKHGCDVRFIDSNGWIPVEPLHPLRDGHRTVAEHLVSRLKEIVK
jgi:lysophospholipase L1-like esterase